MAAQAILHELIVRLFIENPHWPQRRIAKEAKASKKTVYNALTRFKQDLNLTRKPGSGRKKGFACPRKAEKVVHSLEKNPGLSNRKLAEKADCSEFLVRKIKKDAGLKTYKVQTVPDRNAKKNMEAKNRARKLKSDFFQKINCCIMDDETYVLCDFAQLPGQEFYSAMERGGVAEQFKTKKKAKFPKKFLVWQAICSCGQRSQSYVTSGTINSEIYIKECLEKRLLPFMGKHTKSTFFWPDLASCHYSNATKEWYTRNNVTLVPKEANPPNCPELRPIERYWALVKRELKSTKKEAGDIVSFRNKWNAASRRIPESTIKALMAGIPNKLSNFCTNN